jgi:hypothetical protein
MKLVMVGEATRALLWGPLGALQLSGPYKFQFLILLFQEIVQRFEMFQNIGRYRPPPSSEYILTFAASPPHKPTPTTIFNTVKKKQFFFGVGNPLTSAALPPLLRLR